MTEIFKRVNDKLAEQRPSKGPTGITVYFYAVSHYGDYPSLIHANWSVIVPIGLGMLWLATFHQFHLPFFQLYYQPLNSNFHFQAITGIGYGFINSVQPLLMCAQPVVTASLTSTAGADLLIAGFLCYYLNYKKTGIKRLAKTCVELCPI
ncbi:hypothetical protein B0H13DRAFT_1903998 [Mycena leptocephala]|nr:hypothetical protein B0H13DRAFT_1903998 [Mycena leptocephala]